MKMNDVGLGLRFEHFDEVIADKSRTAWFEVIVEDFLSSGPHLAKLEHLRESRHIAMHSVGLNIGGISSFEEKTLKTYRAIYERFEPSLISDHLCWSEHQGHFHHDLLPIFKSKESLQLVVDRVNFLQDYFNRELCLENITTYIDYRGEEFDEIDFLTEVTNRTGCYFLLDISNVLINHKNRKKEAQSYFERFPLERVKQVHLAGSSIDTELDMIIDSHSEPVPEKDIKTLIALRKQGLSAPVMIERDANLPSYENLKKEISALEEKLNEVHG